MNKIIFPFYLYRISSRLYFHLSILFVYFYLGKIDLFQVEILLAIYGVTLSLTSGVSPLLVRFMRYKSVIALGELCKAIGLLILVIKMNFWVAVCGQIITALGYSLGAGTDSSLLRSFTSSNKLTSEIYNRTESNTQSYMFISTLVSGVIGSMLFQSNQHYAFYASMIANGVALLAILFIPEEGRQTSSTTSSSSTAVKQKLVVGTSQKFWMNYYSISRAFTLASYVGFLPYLFFSMLQVSLIYFGIVLSLFSMAAFFSARFIVKLSNKVDANKLTMITMGTLLISILLFGLVDQLWVDLVAITLIGLASGGVRPLTMKNLNNEVVSVEIRTRLLKSMEQRYGVWNALLLLVGGYIISVYGFHFLMNAMAIAYFVSLLIMFTRGSAKAVDRTEENQTTSV